jgi:hypothetical protein
VKTKIAAAASAGTALWLSIGRLAITDPDSARRIGVVPSWWLLAVLIAATIAIVVAIRLPSTACLPLFLSLLIVVPWLPLPVPDLFLALTGPVVLFVWAAIAIGLIAVGVRTRRPPWLSAVRGPHAAPYAAAILAFAAFLAVWTGQRLPPTGDEPHYLLTAQSLLLDHDAKVLNNYQRGDYLPYYGGFLTPHLSPRGVDGVYPGHGVGLSAMLAPVFALGGYRAVAVWIAALVAIATALVWRAGYVLTDDAGAAWFGWAVVAFTAPVAVHGFLIYPDSVAAIVFAACAWAVVQADALTARRTSWPLLGSLAMGAGVGLLPWLHVRLVLPACIFAGLLLMRVVRFRERRWAHVMAIAAPITVCIVGWLAGSWLMYGTINPAAPLGDRNALQVSRIPVGLLGLLTDQEFGLLPNAPVHLLSFAALWSVFKRNNRLGVDMLLMVVPYALTLSAWGIWWAGASPPARFFVPMIFPLGVAAAGLWAQQGARARALSFTLLGASMMVAAAFAWAGDGALAYNDATGRARWLEWVSPLVNLPRAFPSFFRAGAIYSPTAQTIADLAWPTLTWTLAALGGWVAFVTFDKRLGPSWPMRAVSAPACLALAFAIGVSASWRVAGGGNHLTPTRAQLDLLQASQGRLRPIGLQLFPWHVSSSQDLATRVAVTTSPLDVPSRNTLLFLTEVPAGDYRLQVTRTSPAHGELSLGIGRATLPIERWPVSDEWDDYTFHLGARAASLTLTGNDAAMLSVQQVALIPVGLGDATSGSRRARDAVRYSGVVVYALDDRVSLDGGGFWVMGERRPNVIVSANHPVSFVDLIVHNRPVSNTIRVRSGRWYAERELNPDETWRVRVPLPEAVQDVTVGFDVARGIRPADVDPASRDRRPLGCWIEMVEVW